ncbi:hypothetical protein [Pantoea sp.]|uniref:hypothetical protein n=1 Tax=Pantoea sp. TaxID=69393 RepID=UPI002897AC54|nr:hypothetical protein [Pantoea sp.]
MNIKKFLDYTNLRRCAGFFCPNFAAVVLRLIKRAGAADNELIHSFPVPGATVSL